MSKYSYLKLILSQLSKTIFQIFSFISYATCKVVCVCVFVCLCVFIKTSFAQMFLILYNIGHVFKHTVR